MKFDAIVFDLDGTITRSAPGIMGSAKYALSELGKPIPGESVLLRFVGPPLRDSFRELCGLNEDETEKAVALFRKRHNAVGWKEACVYPGIFELLYSLKKAGCHVALASSKSLALCEKTLEYFGLRRFFDRVVAPVPGGPEISKRELILSALPENAKAPCMVGDRMFDMRGAKEAGVYAVGALYGYGSEEELSQSGADETACDVKALRRALLGDFPMPRGRFITFEGSDGCGKSTQHKLLKQYLESCGVSVVSTREPGGCPISERIRGVLLDVSSMGMTDECEALLFAAARTQHVHDTILPALESGCTVLCDRFVDSSVAYQGAGRGLGDWVKEINARAVKNCLPDLTLVFDISPEEALARRLSQSQADRIELSKGELQRRVYEAFIEMCEGPDERFYRIDAAGSIEQIADSVRQKVMELLTGEAEDKRK
jgi:thymidylate kinase